MCKVLTKQPIPNFDCTVLGERCLEPKWVFPRHALYKENEMRGSGGGMNVAVTYTSARGMTSCPLLSLNTPGAGLDTPTRWDLGKPVARFAVA